MMKWSKKLYMGETAERKRFRIISQIKHGQYENNVYIIALSSNKECLLDLIPVRFLVQDYYKEQELWVVGAALGKGEAMEVVRRIVDEVYQKRGDCQVREYLAGIF